MENQALTQTVSNIPHRLTFDEAVEIWLLTSRGEYKHKMAARFDVNVGRIYDVYSEKIHPGSKLVAEYLMRHETD
jgi:hypothetical protein